MLLRNILEIECFLGYYLQMNYNLFRIQKKYSYL